MAHCDPELLALRALGEAVDAPSDEAHLAGCSSCQVELDQLKAVVTTGRTVTVQDTPQPPPPAIWDRIAAELELAGPAAAAAPVRPQAELPAPRQGRRAGGRSRALLALAAAAAGVLAGVTSTLAVTRDGPDAPDERLVARAALEPLPAQSAAGDARLVSSEGQRRLAVTVQGLAPYSGYYEVWLLDRTAKRLVSLGVLAGSDGSFPIPADLDVAAYPLVDISREPLDGNPAHSSDSVARGTLGA